MEGKWSHKSWTVKIRGEMIQIIWDDNVSAWVATSKDVPGLVLKDADFRRLETGLTKRSGSFAHWTHKHKRKNL